MLMQIGYKEPCGDPMPCQVLMCRDSFIDWGTKLCAEHYAEFTEDQGFKHGENEN